MASPFVKFIRSEAAEELMRYPNSFTLLAQIAFRARREPPKINPYKMVVGEAQIGDHAAIGLTRQQFRSALSNLQQWGLITIRPTNKGTIAKLCNTDIYDINSIAEQPSNQPTNNHQPNQQTNHAATTNKNDKNEKEVQAGGRADFSSSISKPRSAKSYRYDNAPVFERTAFKEYLTEIGFAAVDWSLYLVQMTSKIKNATADPKSRLNQEATNEKWKEWILTYLNNDKRDSKLLLPDKQADAQFYYVPEPKPEEGPLTPEILAFRQKLQDEQDAKLLANVARFSHRP